MFNANGYSLNETFERIGIYGVKYEYNYPLFKTGEVLYTESNGEWYPVSTLYEFSPKEFDNFCSFTPRGNAVYSIVTSFAKGVAGMDDVSISDATMIQKHIAGMDISDIVCDDNIKYLDVDNDGDVTIKDATTLQKYLAGLDIEVENSIV